MTSLAALSRFALAMAALGCLTAVVAIVGAGAIFRQDFLALALLAGAILALPALAFLHRAVLWDGRSAFWLCILLIVMETAVFRIRDIDDKSIDAQILMKLAGLGLMGLMAATAFVRLGLSAHPRDAFVWFAFLLYGLFSAIIGIRPDLALVETFSHLAAFGLLYGMMRLLGRSNFINGLVAACFVLCLMSIIAYVAIPTLGRMSDWIDGAFVPTARLQGVFGTANAAGGAAGASLVLLFFLTDIPRKQPLYILMAASFALCLILSNNRMAMAALGISALYIYLRKGDLTLKLAVGVLGIGVAVLAYLGFGEELLESLSRSGSADEIMSGTGRTRIWTVVLHLWSEQPIFGYGAGSAKYILPKEPELFKAAAHAHDLYLNILFAGGIVGLGLFLTGLVLALREASRRSDHGAVSLLLFFLVYGITEPTLEGLASFVPMMFYAAMILALPQTSAFTNLRRIPIAFGNHPPTPSPGVRRPT